MKMKPRSLPVLIAACLLGSGCVNRALTRAIVEAPNLRDVPPVLAPGGERRLRRDEETYATELMVPVGPPAARLSVAVVEPGDYRLVHTIEKGDFKNGKARVWPRSEWTLPARGGKAPAEPKATMLVLHGYQDSKEDMMHWAILLAQSGYRVVLVDLRGHGRSTGAWIGYGAFEARDLKQVIDDLAARGLVSGPLGVLGLSYGASVGLQLAGADPRVAAVVAIEPFSDPRTAVAEFARAVVPGLVKNWSDRDFVEAEDRAALLAHFAWRDADVLGSVARASAPVLYVYAANDHWIAPENTLRLAAATRSPHSVMTVHFKDTGGLEDHVLLSWILDPVAPQVFRWLDASLIDRRPGVAERLDALGFGR